MAIELHITFGNKKSKGYSLMAAALRSKATDATKAFKNLNTLELNYLQISKYNVNTVISLQLDAVMAQLRNMLLKK